MTVPLLDVQGLSKRFVRAGKPILAVDNITFQLQAGKTLVLAGPSGSGKSTVARLVMQLLRPNSGTVAFKGVELGALDSETLRRARRGFQMVFQDTTGAFNPRATVASALDDPLRIHTIAPRDKRPGIIASLLSRVGLDPSLAQRAIHEVSGGQRQRIAIARAIATSPDLIVLDEALSAVDSSVRGEIVRLLQALQAESGVGYLFITHDLALARAVGDHIAIMDAGRIAEYGDVHDVIDAPQSAIGKALVAAAPRMRREA